MTRRWKALTPERVDELPDSCRCCAFWESRDAVDPVCGASVDRALLVAWLETVLEEWGDCGRIAYEDGEVLGLVKYAPPRFLPQVAHMPAGPPSEDAVLLACLHVGRQVRSAGLGKVLLQAALRDLSARGEKALEAYGAAFASDRDTSPLVTVEFLVRQGFQVVRPHPRFPLLRLELKALVAWSETVEALLESLSLPLRSPERAPAPLARATVHRPLASGGGPR